MGHHPPPVPVQVPQIPTTGEVVGADFTIPLIILVIVIIVIIYFLIKKKK